MARVNWETESLCSACGETVRKEDYCFMLPPDKPRCPSCHKPLRVKPAYKHWTRKKEAMEK